MKRITALASALLIAASPLPLIAQERSGPPSGPEEIETGTGATMIPFLGWQSERRDGVLLFTAPEGDVTTAIVGVEKAANGSAAIDLAWERQSPGFAREIELTQQPPARDGWDEVTVVNYRVSPAEKRVVQAVAVRKGDSWTVILIEGALATLSKRGAQLGQALGSLRPTDFTRETFAGRTPHSMTSERIAELTSFVERAMKGLEVPGVGLALIEDGKITWEGGLGITALGSDQKVDENTEFMVASNTKGMATLLLSTLVDDGKIAWDQPVTEVYPSFRLGDADTTAKVRIEHLICACTGLPRKDMQFIFNTDSSTGAEESFAQLAATQPTSDFGEVFQYNNLMASAAGFIAGHVLYPEMEIGASFDRAMDERVFGPLGMTSTTFDFDQAMARDWARPHGRGFSGHAQQVPMEWNRMVYPYRPAGGAWSTTHDMALYALNELREGELPDGTRMVSAEALLKRREHTVPIGEDSWYGMGLMESSKSGKTVVFHGGTLLGYQSNFWVIPEDNVGAVLLTNSDTGWPLLGLFQRKLLELLYDGNSEADEDLASKIALVNEAGEKERARIVAKGDPEVLAGLATNYVNEELGPIRLSRDGDTTWLQWTTGKTTVGTVANEDGSQSLVMTTPGLFGFSLVIGERDGKRALILMDAQHEYVFREKPE